MREREREREREQSMLSKGRMTWKEGKEEN
jgi:hypothetical protein